MLMNSAGAPYVEADYIHHLNRATQTATIARTSQPHCLASFDVYRFDSNEAIDMGDVPLLPAPALDRFAGVFVDPALNASEPILKIVDLANQPLATLGPTDCNLIEWSPDGSLLAWVDTNTQVQRYKITRVSMNGSTDTMDVPEGTYRVTPDRPKFSSDGRWMAYRADGNLFLARIDEMGVEDAVQVNVDLVSPETDRVGSYRFSPNGRALVYAAAGQIAGLDDLYFVDLSANAPGPSLRISPDLSGFPDGDSLEIPPPDSDQDEYSERRSPSWNPWSPDSSKVFFVVHDGGSAVGDTLYVVNVLDPQPTPVHVYLAPCDPSSCGRIFAVAAQPLR